MTTAAEIARRRKSHESLMLSPKQARRIKESGSDIAESSPSDYTVTDPAAHAVRRALEDRAEQRELERMLKPGWED